MNYECFMSGVSKLICKELIQSLQDIMNEFKKELQKYIFVYTYNADGTGALDLVVVMDSHRGSIYKDTTRF
jgi:hypothetical protein